ncbi:hypothetical protein JKP88DRAFT_282657 [Tribonema minus]|uniref:Gag protein n=1 Tax=Tribonema minus TaxID=303371 RepID=A0A835YJR5_9STRA|nr:hypothetical protein JKP88DRAFT_282657 [Tribonema minus]
MATRSGALAPSFFLFVHLGGGCKPTRDGLKSFLSTMGRMSSSFGVRHFHTSLPRASTGYRMSLPRDYSGNVYTDRWTIVTSNAGVRTLWPVVSDIELPSHIVQGGFGLNNSAMLSHIMEAAATHVAHAITHGGDQEALATMQHIYTQHGTDVLQKVLDRRAREAAEEDTTRLRASVEAAEATAAEMQDVQSRWLIRLGDMRAEHLEESRSLREDEQRLRQEGDAAQSTGAAGQSAAGERVEGETGATNVSGDGSGGSAGTQAQPPPAQPDAAPPAAQAGMTASVAATQPPAAVDTVASAAPPAANVPAASAPVALGNLTASTSVAPAPAPVPDLGSLDTMILEMRRALPHVPDAEMRAAEERARAAMISAPDTSSRLPVNLNSRFRANPATNLFASTTGPLVAPLASTLSPETVERCATNIETDVTQQLNLACKARDDAHRDILACDVRVSALHQERSRRPRPMVPPTEAQLAAEAAADHLARFVAETAPALYAEISDRDHEEAQRLSSGLAQQQQPPQPPPQQPQQPPQGLQPPPPPPLPPHLARPRPPFYAQQPPLGPGAPQFAPPPGSFTGGPPGNYAAPGYAPFATAIVKRYDNPTRRADAMTEVTDLVWRPDQTPRQFGDALLHAAQRAGLEGAAIDTSLLKTQFYARMAQPLRAKFRENRSISDDWSTMIDRSSDFYNALRPDELATFKTNLKLAADLAGAQLAGITGGASTSTSTSAGGNAKAATINPAAPKAAPKADKPKSDECWGCHRRFPGEGKLHEHQVQCVPWYNQRIEKLKRDKRPYNLLEGKRDELRDQKRAKPRYVSGY